MQHIPPPPRPHPDVDVTIRSGSITGGQALIDALEIAANTVKTSLRQGAVGDADLVNKTVHALKEVAGLECAVVRIETFIDAAQYFYVIGQPFNAIEPAQNAVRLSRLTGEKHLLRKALTVFGIVSSDTGNISQALEAYSEALELADHLHDQGAKGLVLINVGVALFNCAQYRDAIACFDTAMEIVSDNPQLVGLRLSALSNIALCSLHLEDFSRGLRAAETVVKESPEPTSAAELLARVLRENNYIRLLLEVNNVEKAKERCQLARKFASASHSAKAEIAASLSEGLCEVQSGQADVGISRLTSTLERARLMRSMLRDALAALIKAYEIVGQPERALMYLREMMETIRQTQQDNALRHVKIHLDNLEVGSELAQDVQPSLTRREAALKGLIAEQELFRSRVEMLERLAVTAELRDDSTGEHSYRVGKLASLLAAEYGCDEGTCFMIELAARLHDIGKIGVPDAILLKPEKLNDAERTVMRSHTVVGAELLSKSNIPQMQMAEEIARYHHEWWDGTGYPGNLSGTGIPLGARIAALADVFDALTHQRPYKSAWPVDKALDEIASLQGKQFDPQLTAMFLGLVANLRQTHPDLDAYLGQAAQNSPFIQARSKIWDTLRKSRDGDALGVDSRIDLQR